MLLMPYKGMIMINQKIMLDAVLNRLGLITKSLWRQVVLQLAFVAPVGLLSGWLFIDSVRQAVIDIEEQTVQARLGIHAVQQKLDAMPLLSVLRAQLAGKITQSTSFQSDRLAQLLVKPLSQAGASLLSWQPVSRSAETPHQERWQLTFSADYAGVLQVLRELTALPYVLRIAQLTVKPDTAPTALPSEAPRLQVELSLIGPEVAQ
ncbi:putative membrane protein [Pectobacterium parmentieri]|uniref:Membrane protein n=2 Tax=Pectobacterium parmentieri TaxID=1905730 RepID=A0A0H3IB62_PECPM|nr:putative membrane protein [Pectobacterium parmentieri]